MSTRGTPSTPASPSATNSAEIVTMTEADEHLVEEHNAVEKDVSKDSAVEGDSAAADGEDGSVKGAEETGDAETKDRKGDNVTEARNDEIPVENQTSDAPPLPSEAIPPLPSEAPPDDGWEPRWEETQQAWYFYNRFTGNSQWDNPRVPATAATSTIQLSGPPGVSSAYATASAIEQPPELSRRPAGGYDPAIHGDYDPTAWYAQPDPQPSTENPAEASNADAAGDPAAQYAAIGAFNRFTGRWQNTDVLNPENYNDENKSKRQMNAFFDVDAAANSHDGRSLKAERSGKKVSKTELKQFKEKRKAKKEEKRRAWLRD